MLTATHQYLTQGYQGCQWRDITESISGLVDGAFRDETIHSLFDRFSLSKLGSTLNLINTLLLIDTPEMHVSR